MADISHLTNLKATDPIDWEDYPETSGTGFQLPPKGRYILRAPDRFPPEAFEETPDGFLKARIDPIVEGPTNTGFEIRYITVSAKLFDRGNKKGSRLGDYVRAAAPEVNPGNQPSTQADAIEATAGRTYEADLDWEAYFSEDQSRVRGMENFPDDGQGGKLQWAIHHSLTDPATGEPLRKRARLVIRRFIAAS